MEPKMDELHSWLYECMYAENKRKAQRFADKAVKKIQRVMDLQFNPDYLDFQKGVAAARKMAVFLTLNCMRCGHLWHPRTETVRMCPKCKSPYWDKARVR